MITLTDRNDELYIEDAEYALKEISKCRQELKKISSDTAKAIMLIKECAKSEENELEMRIKELESRLKKFAEKNIENRASETSIPVAEGVVGFRKRIRYKALSEPRSVKSIELHLKSLSKTESFFYNAGVKLRKRNLNKLSNETLKRLGLHREENMEFFYRIDGFKSAYSLPSPDRREA